jgi:catecholate siderophore receptor
LITGFEIGRDTYDNQSYSRTGKGLPTGMVGFESLESPSSAGFTGVTMTEGNLASSFADSLGVYFNDTMSLSDQWKVVLGLRHDTFDAELTNTISAPASGIEDTGFTSKRAGLIYQPTHEQSYYISYGTSFDPLLEQMTLTSGTQELPPTNTRSYEIGTKWDLMHDKFSWSAAAFNERQNNVYSLANDVYVASGNWLIKGVSLSAVGQLTDKLQLSAGYMHLDPRVVDTSDGTNGSIPANVPKNTATLFATYAVTPVWEVGGGPSYVSQRFVADSGISATSPKGNVDRVSVPGYVRLDATVAYHQPHYDIRLNVFNLTNKFYYDALIASDGGRSVPGIGRTGLITFTYRF